MAGTSNHADKAIEAITLASREPLTAEDQIAIAQVHALLAIAFEMQAQREERSERS